MQKAPEISSKQPSSVCYVVGGESVVIPASPTRSIAWDNRQLRLQMMPNPAQMVQGLLLGSTYRRLDNSNDQEVPLQILDAGAQVVVGESLTDVKRFGLAVADGSGGHYGDHQQDQQIADVAKLCSQLALSELNRYDDPDKCYAALPAIVKTLAAAAKTQGLTESCSFSAMLAFVGKDDMTVVGLGIGDCLLASLQLDSGLIETICPAHESDHGAAMFPQGYHEVELRYFQHKLPKGSVLLGFTDGLWAGLPHVKFSKTYATGLAYHEIKLDSQALAPLLLPRHTHGLGAVAYDILVQHALQTIETKRAQAKQHWDSATQAKAALPSVNSEEDRNLDPAIKLRDDGIPYTSVHNGDDSLGQMMQLQSLEGYRLDTLIELLPENVKRLAEGALRSPYSTWQEPLSLVIQKEMPGSFVWTYGLCLLSQGLMQNANRDKYFETYVAGLKYAAAALKGATCLTGQLLAKTQLQYLLHTYTSNELNNELKNKNAVPIDIGMRLYKLHQHRQGLRQRLQKETITALIKSHQDFLITFVTDQWQDLLGRVSVDSLKELITLLALGSVGRGEPAPYSDFEFAWVIDKTLPVVKQRLLKKLTEWWYLHVIALGETKTASFQSNREPFVKAGFTFDMDVGGLSPLMNDRLINTPEGLAALQEEDCDSDLILRNALISCCYLWGSKRLFDEYQSLLSQRLNQPSGKTITKSLLSKKLKRSQAHALSLLEAALSEFAPSSLNTLKERKQALGFKVKEELYRLVSQALTGLCWYYQHYIPGGFQQLQWLQDHKKLHNETRKHIQHLLEQALHWRYLAQLFYGCEFEALFPAGIQNEYSGHELFYQLSPTEHKNIQELYRILLPLEQATQRFLQDKCGGKKSNAFATKGLYSQDEITLAVAQARMGNYHEAEKYYQVITLNSHDPSLYLLRLQNLGQRYEQLQAMLREHKYLTSLGANQRRPINSSSYEEQAQGLKDKAQDIIRQLLVKIISSPKELIQQLETLYRQLPFVFRESFRVALLKLNDQQPILNSTLQTTLSVLHRHPDISTERLRWTKQKQQWRTVLRQCIDEQRPATFENKVILLHSTLFGQKPLAAGIGEQLLAKGEFKNQHIGGGIHRVIKLNLNLSEDQIVYAKAYPEMPGMTYLIEQLHLRLLGHGVGLSELVKLDIPKKGPMPVLLSFEVKGPTLDAVLRGEPQALKDIQATTTAEALHRLDKHLVMGLMLLAMLTNPEDGIPTNFIYHLTPDNKATLVSIDHDHALFPSYLGEELQVKTILFCLPLLKEMLPESLKQDILALEAGNELRAVLRDAQSQNKAYSALFDAEMMKTWHQQRKGGNTTIPIPIKKGDATKLYFKLVKLQTLIKDKPELTGLACLQALEPRVGAVYAKALQEDKSPQQRLQEIGRYTADKQGALISNTQALKSLQLTSTLLSQPEYAKLQDLSPEEGLTELDIIAYQSELIADIQQEVYQGNLTRFQQVLHPIHQAQVISGEPRKRLKPLQWERLSKDQQRLVLDAGKHLTFDHLDLTKCEALTEARLQLLLNQSPDLISLTLDGYNGFSEKTLRLINKACPSLERLVLRNLSTSLSEGMKQAILFPVLKELQIHHNQLVSLPIQCPHLETLILSECARLSTHMLTKDLTASPNLQHVQINQCENIDRQELGRLLLREPGIRNDTLGLTNLLIKDNLLSLIQLQPTADQLTLLMRYHPTVQVIYYPNADSKVIYAVVIDILANNGRSIIFNLKEHVEKLVENKTVHRSGIITALAALPDNRVVSGDMYKEVSGDAVNVTTTIKVWDLSNPDDKLCVHTLRGQSGIITTLAVLPDGRVVSGLQDGILMVWDLTYPEEKACRLILYGHQQSINALAVLPDGRVLSGSLDRTTKVWDLTKSSNQACQHTLLGHKKEMVFAVLPDGYVVGGFEDTTIRIWDFAYPDEKACLQTLRGHGSAITALVVLPDKQLVSGEESGRINIWDLTSLEKPLCIKTIRTSYKILTLGRLPDNRIVTGTSHAMFACSTACLGDESFLQTDNYAPITALAVLSDSRVVTSIFNTASFNVWHFSKQTGILNLEILRSLTQKIDLHLNEPMITIRLLPQTGMTKNSPEVLQHFYQCLELISKSGTLIQTTSKSAEELVVTTPLAYVYARLVHFLLHLKPRLVAGSLPRDITDTELQYRLLHYPLTQSRLVIHHHPALTQTGILQILTHCHQINYIQPSWLSLPIEPTIDSISTITMLPDGRIVTGFDNLINVWAQAYTGAVDVVKTLSGHSDNVTALAVLPDGRLVSGAADKTIKIWDLTRPEGEACIRTLLGHKERVTALVVVPDGRVVSGSDDLMLKVWDLTRPEEQACVTLRGHISRITALVVLPDGRVVSGAADNMIKVWDLTYTEGEPCQRTLSGHQHIITTLMVLRDGRILSGSADKTIKDWGWTGQYETTYQTTYQTNGHLSEITGLAALPDGRVVSYSSDRALKVWDLKYPEIQACTQTLYGHRDWVISLAALGDGRVVSRGTGRSLMIWPIVPDIDLTALRALPLPLIWEVDSKKNIIEYKITNKLTPSSLQSAFQVVSDLLRTFVSSFNAFITRRPNSLTAWFNHYGNPLRIDIAQGTLSFSSPDKDSLQQAEAVFQAIQTRLQALATLDEKREHGIIAHPSPENPQPSVSLAPAIAPNSAQLLLKHSSLWAPSPEPVVTTQDDLKKSSSTEVVEALPIKQPFK